uniref:Uncharacterized protein n=1 Tax=viral metagenome TaxID=1070528 RepID=A0A6C0H8B0_9ZZZZ
MLIKKYNFFLRDYLLNIILNSIFSILFLAYYIDKIM